MFTQSLDGAWQLRQVGWDEAVKARVPGCIHLDLLRAKKIEHPFCGDNEHKVAWVHETDWEYSRAFVANERLLDSERVYLECNGIDTVADIIVNGRDIAHVENMYLAYRFDVKDALVSGENTIRIQFTSPVKHIRSLVEKDPLLSPGESIPGAAYTRKSPSQWGWDWAPKLPTSGIWRSIRLAAYDTGRIEDLKVRQNHRRKGQVTLDLEIAVERFHRAPCDITVRLRHPDGKVEDHQIRPFGSRAKCSITIEKPKLWWPNGYGDHPLYTVEAILKSDDVELHKFTRPIGLRSIKLDQKKDRYGRSFTFVVNGVRIFCKGANWVPADHFPARISDQHYRHLISGAAKANMNMLRVWGGGFYEDERFYDLCDQHGILVWQDFMFSCALYPRNDAYLDSVRCEAEQVVTRLRDRACLALWCGNNEVEWFLNTGVAGEKAATRKRQYQKIFHDLLPSIVGRLDRDTTYWPSSPSSALKPFEDPNSQESGDGHYWEVWGGQRLPLAAYRTAFHRFTTEFGFQSLPAFETVKSFAKTRDFNMTSRVMESHQKDPGGNGRILHYLAQTFRLPRNFEMMCYVTQLLQAEAMRCAVEHWRRRRGRCMGALHWQLNDCWPAVSWSSIDYFGRWKALQYFARRFFSPVILSVVEDGHTVELHATNDTTKPARSEVRWSLQDFDGNVIRKSKIKTKIEQERNKLLATLDFSDELTGDAAGRTVLVHELLVNGKPAGRGMVAFAPIKHLDLPRANIECQVKTDDDGYYIEVASDKTAQFVCLTVPRHDVIFSDNYFDLPAGRKTTVRVESDIDAAALSRVRAYSLRDSY